MANRYCRGANSDLRGGLEGGAEEVLRLSLCRVIWESCHSVRTEKGHTVPDLPILVLLLAFEVRAYEQKCGGKRKLGHSGRAFDWRTQCI